MNNGSGLRVVLWLSGCDHKCKGCQNPQTWDANSGILFDTKAKEELFRELDKDYISGLTLTGGDPLHPSNLDGALDIVTEFNKRYKTTQDMVSDKNDNHHEIRLSMPEKTIWLYTGFTWEELTNNRNKLAMIDYLICEEHQVERFTKEEYTSWLRFNLLREIDVLVEGRYIDSQRNISLKWRGSSNQRVINTKESLKQNKIILHCN